MEPSWSSTTESRAPSCCATRCASAASTSMASIRAGCLEHLRTAPADVVVTDVQMAGMSGHRAVRGAAPAAPRSAADRHDRPGRPRHRDRGDPRRRLRLHHQAGQGRRARHRGGAARSSTSTLAARGQAAARRRRDRDVPVDGIAGDSPAIRETIELVRRVADSDATVLVTGESGTGKELVARALHELSPRRDHPFVAVNCAAMPAPLLESELFGHVRGAFTDAKRVARGPVRAGGRGHDLPRRDRRDADRDAGQAAARAAGAQGAPGRRRRGGAVRRARHHGDQPRPRGRGRRRSGSARTCSTGSTSSQIPVPPLRDARAATSCCSRSTSSTASPAQPASPCRASRGPAARLLLDYDWPGNVRELENCIERAVALCRLDEITVDDLPAKVQEHHSSSDRHRDRVSPAELITLDEMERRYVRAGARARSAATRRTPRASSASTGARCIAVSRGPSPRRKFLCDDRSIRVVEVVSSRVGGR